jgi:O-antigen/teichoic acid export membrane protein
VLRQISAKPEETDYAIRASFPLRTLVSALAIAVAVAIGLAAPFPHLTKVAIVISSIGSLFTLMTLSLVPVFQARLQMHWAVGSTIAGRLLTLALTVGALAAGFGFKAVVLAQVAGLALIFVLHVLIVRRHVSLRPIVDVAYWRGLVAGSFALGLAIALSQIYFRIDAVLLALLTNAYEVGLYGAAYKFLEISYFVVTAIVTSAFPPLARFVATGDPRARPLVQKAFDVLIAAAAPITVGLAIFATPIIVTTAGEEFREAADALRILSPYVLFSFVGGLFFHVLIVCGRDRVLLGSTLAILVANVALNLAFIPAYGFRAAAAISVITEAAVLVPLALAVRRRGLAPGLRYAATVAGAAAVMALVGLAVPGPALVPMVACSLAYALVLLALPGTARDVVFRSLVPAARRLVTGAAR